MDDSTAHTVAAADGALQSGPERTATRWNSSPKLIAFLAVFLLFLAGLSMLVIRKSGPAQLGKEISSQSNGVSHLLRFKGTTEAIQARTILAPALSGQTVGTLTITRLLTAGSKVKAGDLLVEFDRQAQIRDFLDKQADYNKLVGQVAEQQAKENSARAKDETELHQAASALKNADLEMKTVELMSRIDVEKAHENQEQARATLQQLKETFELKRSAARAAIRILEIQRDRTQRIMKNAQTNADLMQIHSPLDGVVVLNTIWKNGRMGEVQEGDQVQPGVPFMRVVNPSAMQVQVLVNQEDILGLRIGQDAKVRLDAYPELVLPGKLEEIAPIARNGGFSSKVRTFSTIFSIQGTDSRLMPDLSAAVDVAVDAPAGDTKAER
jgi:HlyD family secretion protein